jgi:hypothetical protein
MGAVRLRKSVKYQISGTMRSPIDHYADLHTGHHRT